LRDRESLTKDKIKKKRQNKEKKTKKRQKDKIKKKRQKKDKKTK